MALGLSHVCKKNMLLNVNLFSAANLSCEFDYLTSQNLEVKEKTTVPKWHHSDRAPELVTPSCAIVKGGLF